MLNDLISSLHHERDRIRSLTELVKEHQRVKTELEAEIIDILDKEGITLMRGEKATISISEKVVPTVEDWDTFYTYILDSKQPYLLERRPSVSAYREIIESGEEVPGVNSFTKRTLNMKTAV